MEATPVKLGWIYEQSSFLKRMCKRWMVLTQDSLRVYKKQDDTEATQEIPLSSIKAVAKKEPRKDFFTFQVSTAQRELVFFSEDLGGMEHWVQCIDSVATTPKHSPKVSTQAAELHTTEQLRSKFDQLKALLQERELELLAANEALVSSLRQVADSQDTTLSTGLDTLLKSFEHFSEVLEQTPRDARLMRQVKTPSFEECNVSCGLPQFAGSPRVLQTLLTLHTRVAFINPHELKVTRSRITRALKWQYSGDKADALTFAVSTQVQLTGIGLCRPYKPGGQVNVLVFKLLSGSETNSKVVYTHPRRETICYDDLASVATVRIPPLALTPGQQYTAYFVLEGSPTFKCVDCSSQSVNESVVWRYATTLFTGNHQSNRTDVICGPIAEFNFMLSK